MCRQPDVTVSPDQGHHLLAANMECTALLTLTREGEAGAVFCFCLKSPVHRLSPKAASRGCCGPCIAASPGPRVRLQVLRSRNCEGPCRMSVSSDLGKGAARGAHAGGENRVPVTKHGHDWAW